MASDGLRERLADQLDGLGCGCDQPAGRLADAALTAVAAWLRDEAARYEATFARVGEPYDFAAGAIAGLADDLLEDLAARSLDGEQTTNPEEGA